MRVLLLSQYYYPEPVEKVHDLARGLVRLGHEVQVVTGFPCYPRGQTYAGIGKVLYSGNVSMVSKSFVFRSCLIIVGLPGAGHCIISHLR